MGSSNRPLRISSCHDGSLRLRVDHLHIDQVATLRLAMEKARRESPTDFDSVLLERICFHYLSSG
jgi:hypothetical protein